MVMQAYIDDSRTAGEVLVLAGFIASAKAWAKFSIEWAERLAQSNLEEFKMSDRQYTNVEMNGYFYRVIENHIQSALCCVVPIRPLVKIVDELGMHAINKNPYYFAFKAIINGLAQEQVKLDNSEPTDFIFDEQGEKNKILRLWDSYVDSIPAEIGQVTGSKPVFMDSKKALPLQAADMMAWWYRRRWDKHKTLKIDQLPYPWSAKRDYLRYMMQHGEDDYRAEFIKEKEMMMKKYKYFISHSFKGSLRPRTS